jgi:NADPH-dependent 2,4-dienoyl-CoA reductase/sulfur reductase-like enzyme/nitrite reductase/ring-hydroxylating ferredoxin subunit
MAQDEKELVGPDLTLGIALDDIGEGGKLLGHAGGEQVLLVRRGTNVYALEPNCTHYHQPLVEGLVVEDTIRCSLHHACFSLRTGEALRGPAFVDLNVWSVEQRAGQVFVRDKRPARQAPRSRRASSSAPGRIVIVGGGAAAFAAAETLRREQFSGSVVMLSSEDETPIDRTNLSKDFLASDIPYDWIALRPDKFYADNGIDVRVRTTVIEINRASRTVRLSDGSALEYDKLLLATGAEPIRPSIPGADQEHVRTLRTLPDSRSLIERAAGGRQVLIIGAGFIGLEVAASLRTRGARVSVVAPERIPMQRVLGAQLGEFIRSLHEKHEVVFHLEDAVLGLEGKRVTLKSGNQLDADLVVAGISVRPRTELAHRAGLAVEQGISVNAQFQTSDPDIFAAGDVARWPNPQDGAPIRVEHWVVAHRHGQCAALAMIGKPQSQPIIPFFWTQHYDVQINYIGHAEGDTDQTVEGSIAGRDCLVRYGRNGSTLAVASIGRDMDNLKNELAMERAAAQH